MRQILFAALFAAALVAIAPASFAHMQGRAPTARMHHSRIWPHAYLSPRVASSFDAASPWDYERLSPLPHDDTPSYNDPSKFGGSTALPVTN